MSTKGKKYIDALKRFDHTRSYAPGEALELVRSLASAGFDETVEMSVRLGVDPRKADQVIRGTVALPAGTGKAVRVAVFAAGSAAEEARAAGADVVGADDLVAQVDGGFMDFDVAIATPDLMGQVGRLGRKLGPRGLMPNPKTGTVTTDVGRAVGEFKGGRVEYRADTRSRGVVQVPIGKASFDRKDLMRNFRAVIDEVQRVKPAASKGKYIKSVAVSSTMGPGIDVDSSLLRITDEDLAVARLDAAYPSPGHLRSIRGVRQWVTPRSLLATCRVPGHSCRLPDRRLVAGAPGHAGKHAQLSLFGRVAGVRGGRGDRLVADGPRHPRGHRTAKRAPRVDAGGER